MSENQRIADMEAEIAILKAERDAAVAEVGRLSAMIDEIRTASDYGIVSQAVIAGFMDYFIKPDINGGFWTMVTGMCNFPTRRRAEEGVYHALGLDVPAAAGEGDRP